MNGFNKLIVTGPKWVNHSNENKKVKSWEIESYDWENTLQSSYYSSYEEAMRAAKRIANSAKGKVEVENQATPDFPNEKLIHCQFGTWQCISGILRCSRKCERFPKGMTEEQAVLFERFID